MTAAPNGPKGTSGGKQPSCQNRTGVILGPNVCDLVKETAFRPSGPGGAPKCFQPLIPAAVCGTLCLTRISEKGESSVLVSQILQGKGDLVFTASPGETVGAVAALLHARRVGAMIVVEGDEVVGIVSERDIVRAVAEDGAVALTRTISVCMTRDVVFASPSETVDSLLTRMTDRRIRHLPVLRDGRLAGIVSIGDLVKYKISEVEAEADGLKAYIAAG
jgi:CBS domain-containing protein